MGYELKKLMNMYGVSTPTMAPAPQMPGAAPTAVAELVKPELRAQPAEPVKPTKPKNNAPAAEQEAYQAALTAYNAQKNAYDTDIKAWKEEKKTYDTALKDYNTALPKYQEDLAKYEKDKAAFDETVRKYGLDKAQYDQYAQEYQNRLANTNLYNQAQFSTTGANVPAFTTFSDAQKAALGYGPTVTPTVGAPTVGEGESKLAVMPQPVPDASNPNPVANPLRVLAGESKTQYLERVKGIGTPDRGQNAPPGMMFGPNDALVPDPNSGGIVDLAVVVYGPDGTMYSSPRAARDAGVTNYTLTPPDLNSGGTILPVPQPGPQDFTGIGQGGLNQQIQNYMGTNPSMPDLNAYMTRYGLTDYDMRNAMGTGTTYGAPQWTDMLKPPVYGANYAQGGTVRGYAPGGVISGGAGDDVLMGRPAGDMLTPAPAPVVEDPQDASAVLEAMYERYAPKPVDYSAEIAAANERVAAERKAFEEMLLGQLDAQDNAPQSKAEMYFRLAAAFGAPTKTGHFSENLALVGQTMADELAAKAKREREAREKKLGVRTELQKMRMEAAGEELGTLRGLQEDETKYGRELARDLIKDYIASGKPQSEAGRIAMDMGLKPGTPEYNAKVAEQTELKIQRELAAIEASLAATASSTAAAGRMSSTEINLRTETENNLANLNQAISDVAEAYRLNPNSYSGSLTDMAVRKLQETVGSDDPMIVNTRRIENLLGQQALGTLKAVFGGNPTEGERAILLELQGIGAKSLEERGEIMLRLYEVLQERQARETKRLDDILSGAYRSYTPIDGGE